MKIELYTFCYNEMDIIKWAIDYWSMFADMVKGYDNGSTDGSLECLQQLKWVEVKHFQTDGMNDLTVAQIKNNCWKSSNADWVVVCDMDEMLFSSEGVRTSLARAKEQGIDIIYPQWFTLVSDEVPEHTGEFLHRQRPLWTPKQTEAKPLIFQPAKFKEMNFCCGQHYCQPIANAEFFAGHNGAIHCFHIERRLSPEYYIQKTKECQARRSEVNLKYGFGNQYSASESQMLEMLSRDKANAIELDL